MPVETLNFFLGLGTIAMQVASVLLLIAFFTRDRFALSASIVRHTRVWGLWAAFLFSVAGIVLTLYYSEIVGYVPCGLCWMTRIFFYPQAFLFGLALWQKRTDVMDYSLVLAIPGAIIALYKHYLELGGGELLPCPASGAGDCGKRYIFEFDYVTMPLMGFSLLLLLIILMIYLRSAQKEQIELPARN